MARKMVVELVGDASQLERTFRKSAGDAQRWEKSVDRAGRGALSASIHFKGLGRAVAFASTSFLGGYGLTYALESTVKAGLEQQRIIANLRNAVEASGNSWKQYGGEIQRVTEHTRNLSAFDDDELYQSLQLLLRGTGNVNKALKLNALAADVARGRNMGLVQAAQLLVRVNSGQVGSLRRLGIQVSKNATGQQALLQVQRQYAGAAEAYGKTAEGALLRFQHSIQDLQKALGAQLLPALTKIVNKWNKWLENPDHQKQVIDDFTQAVHALGVAAGGAAKGVGALKSAWDFLSNLPGGNVSGLDVFHALQRGHGGSLLFGGLFGRKSPGVPPGQFIPGYGTNLFAPVYGPPQPTPRGLGPLTARTAPIDTTLSAAQQRAIALAGTASMAALQTQAAYDRRAIAFLRQRFAAHKVTAKVFTQMLVSLKNDLQQQVDAIASINQEAADKAKAAADKAKQARADRLQHILDMLGLGVDRAALTKTLTDDLRAQEALRTEIVRQIRGGNKSVELAQQLIGSQQAIQDLRVQQAQNRSGAQKSRMFQALGLTAAGGQRTTVKWLRRRIKQVANKIAGTPADTPGNRAKLARIHLVLSGQFGDPADQPEVLAEIRQELDDIAGQVDTSDRMAISRFRHISPARLAAQLGLAGNRFAIARLAQYGFGGSMPRHSTQLAGAGGMIITGGLHLHGVQNVKQLQNELQKVSRAQPAGRRGAR